MSASKVFLRTRTNTGHLFLFFIGIGARFHLLVHSNSQFVVEIELGGKDYLYSYFGIPDNHNFRMCLDAHLPLLHIVSNLESALDSYLLLGLGN